VRRIAIVTVALCAFLAVASTQAGTRPNVHGVLVRPTAGSGCYQGEPCDPPVTASLLVFTRAGRTIATVRVGAGGQFAVQLPAGAYGIRARPALLGNVTPSSLRVPRSGNVYLRLLMHRSAIPAPAGAG